jgi:prephenate dehydratase
MGRAKKMFIQGAIKHPGALHKSLKVPKEKKIPMAKLEKAAHSQNPTLRKRAVLAETLRKLPRHHGPR